MVDYLISAALFTHLVVFCTERVTEVEEVSDTDACLHDALEGQIGIAQVCVLSNKYYIDAASDYDRWQDNLREDYKAVSESWHDVSVPLI